jgi:4-hydroxy-tetrahydrodipicolinate synthase
MTQFKGVIPALTTPFDGNGQIDEAKYRAQVQFMLRKGVHGVCFGGSTGEGQTLELDEFRRLSAITVEEVKGKVPVVAGIIANSAREVIKRADAIRNIKVDALQVTPVFYIYTPSDEENYQHFKTICDTVKMPILIYNVIPWNLLNTPLVLRILREIPLVVGIKQSQGNITRVAELVANAPKDKVILSAIDNLLYSCFAFGAHGTLAASPTGAPGPVVRLWNAVQEGDHKTGVAIHHRLVNLWSALPPNNMPAAIKYCLALQGVDCGVARQPMGMPDSASRKEIESALKAILEYDIN